MSFAAPPIAPPTPPATVRRLMTLSLCLVGLNALSLIVMIVAAVPLGNPLLVVAGFVAPLILVFLATLVRRGRNRSRISFIVIPILGLVGSLRGLADLASVIPLFARLSFRLQGSILAIMAILVAVMIVHFSMIVNAVNIATVQWCTQTPAALNGDMIAPTSAADEAAFYSARWAPPEAVAAPPVPSQTPGFTPEPVLPHPPRLSS